MAHYDSWIDIPDGTTLAVGDTVDHKFTTYTVDVEHNKASNNEPGSAGGDAVFAAPDGVADSFDDPYNQPDLSDYPTLSGDNVFTGTIDVPAGSLGSPSITFGDANTGLYDPAPWGLPGVGVQVDGEDTLQIARGTQGGGVAGALYNTNAGPAHAFTSEGNPIIILHQDAAGPDKMGIILNGDTNLYRSAANTLATDDKFMLPYDVAGGASLLFGTGGIGIRGGGGDPGLIFHIDDDGSTIFELQGQADRVIFTTNRQSMQFGITGKSIGFFGATPVTQPTSASVTDYASLKVALQNLGLIGT